MNATPTRKFILTTAVIVVCSWSGTLHPQTSEEKPPQPRDWTREYAAYRELSPATRERIKQVDREFREEDSDTQARLLQLMQRYSDWVDRLPPKDRQYLEEAATLQQRLSRIKELREKQWIANLPKPDRDEIEVARKKGPQEYQAAVAKFRERERKAEMEWQVALARNEQRDAAIRDAMMNWRRQIFVKIRSQEERNQKQKELQSLKWPAQFRALKQLADENNVPMPSLLTKVWVPKEDYPYVSPGPLIRFLDTQLSEEDQKDLRSRLRDPDLRENAREQLIELYWQAHPYELRRIREEDELKRKKNQKPLAPKIGMP